MAEIRIPQELLPLDGRFGCGPSKTRAAQIEYLTELNPRVIGTSHRQKPVKDMVARVQAQLLELFQAPPGYEILLANGGATTFWDSATHSLIKNRSQHASFGEFGAKFATAVKNAPFLADPLINNAPAGSHASCETAEGIDFYAYPQNETSTGVMSPVRRYGDDGALTAVDATSAAGGILFDPKTVDIYYFSPQKNFGGDGGIWFALASELAIERIAEVTSSGRYIPEVLNLAGAVENSRKHQTLNTPALASLALMESQLSWMLENGGLKWADQRTRESSEILYKWAVKRDYVEPFVTSAEHRSQVVVTLDFAPEVSAAEVSIVLRANGIVDTEPYRKLGRNQLRIATFVAIEPADISRLTACIDYVVERLA